MELSERETTITYDLAEKVVRIFSAIPRDLRKLEKAGLTPVYGNGRQGFGYQIPLDQFRWRIRPPRAERVLTSNAGKTGRFRKRDLPGHANGVNLQTDGKLLGSTAGKGIPA